MRELSVTRGYRTPNIDAFAKQGLSFQRMYSEPSCTPTRVAMMTGRYPVRTGLTEAKATIAGEGLAAEEVTLAEVLWDAGYYTSHVGKWHLGDIQQAYEPEPSDVIDEWIKVEAAHASPKPKLRRKPPPEPEPEAESPVRRKLTKQERKVLQKRLSRERAERESAQKKKW